MSLCRCIVVAESLRRCFAVSSYRCVAHTFSGPGGDSGKSQELSWTLSCTTVLRRRRSLVLIETADLYFGVFPNAFLKSNRCIAVSLHRCIAVSLCGCVDIWLHSCIAVSLVIVVSLCRSNAVSLYRCVAASVYRSVAVSPYCSV